jgi:tRNA A-37 threonylcarbamoyl transferase component Bud32
MNRWERLKSLFEEALEQPPSARRDWVKRAASDDQDLRGELESLLEAHDTAGDFLEQPVAVDPADLLDLAPGTKLGAYAILEQIGRGGMGVVYLAEDTRLKRRVALKLLPPAVASDPTLRERLRREARAAATISHPAVATVYSLEEIGDDVVLVTEYIPGGTLRDEIARGPLALPRAIAIATDIASALSAAHDAGVVHRDLKPENVVITQTGAVKVVDFGIAHVQGDGGTRLTLDGSVLGTPAYMAPEQLVGNPADGRADVYAAGIVIVEMLTGRHPLDRRADTAVLPADIQEIVRRCLQPDPSARYASAHELVAALETVRLKADTPYDGVVSGFSRTGSTARWWWEFHQAAAVVAYSLAVIPAWTARGMLGQGTGRTLFIVTLAAVIVSGALRLHLWFTSRSYPEELHWARRRVRAWLLGADLIFAVALIVGGLLVGEDGLAVLLLSVGIGAAVAFLVIEPVTARAAFRRASEKLQ